ncbi:ROK family transcriptional regulator [Streptacidiphilus sp. P02-A3a]|uniref:ROK family transcriptional regulator n=1 Tax=Streptacidiphilus sp. P02-A3a TaxID=2704468 RepID=UPI0015FDC500|nr:ROK family transcriptional regulator [Streptacidiphilus sp. P02-A3a]QMU71383.1 ROK family transcriptional regulator [Streptacidiphilus sp. P02-A3a]
MSSLVKHTTRDLRWHNRSALLTHLYVQGPTSRNKLSRVFGLSSATVSNIVSGLIADGLVEDAGLESSDGGRPRSVLRVRSQYGHVVGVDIGETHIRTGLFDWSLTMVAAWEHPIADTKLDPYEVARLVIQGVAEVTARAGLDPDRLLGVGVGVPGAVRSTPEAPDRLLVHAPTLGWSGVRLGDMLRSGISAPLAIDNCARTLGQAEMWLGVGRDARRAVVALIGVGVGAALTPGSKAGPPASDASTIEWGHTVIQAGGLLCRCGSHGCLEAYAGAEAILHSYQATLGSLPFTATGTEPRLVELTERAHTDPVARQTLNRTAEYIGIGIGNLVNLLDPELVVLSGWAGSLIGPTILPAVREAAERHTLPYLQGHTWISVGQLGQEAVAMGAATLPVSRVLAGGGAPEPAQ